MGLFGKKKRKGLSGNLDPAALAQRSLDFIAEAVLVVDEHGIIKFANPAAAAMTDFGDPENLPGLDYQLVIHLENSQQEPVDPQQSLLYTAIHLNQAMNTREYVLSTQSGRQIAIDLACIPTGDNSSDRIITFRDITKELAEEREQAEFISTASHEMRTPVASIEGYLGLSLNPQTATIDERARKYLEAAHAASQHLGKLFKDLLDVTKFDDDRAKIHLIPVDAVEAVAYIASEQSEAMQAKKLRYSFGDANRPMDKKHLQQKIYMAVDYDFLREIVNNLVGNAIKYTPEGGEIKVSVKGEGDKVMITVADSGIGIPASDLGHIFQKFYRVDSTQTREIGGTGLGLYLVKERAEAMGGRVWAESDYGHGSVFYVTLPRISESEYEKMRIAYGNEKMMKTPFVAPVVGTVDVKLPADPFGATATGNTRATIQRTASVLPAQDEARQDSRENNTQEANIGSGMSMPTPASPMQQRPTISASTSAQVSGMDISSENTEANTQESAPPGVEEPVMFERKMRTIVPPSQADKQS